jgi:two-component system, LytTR family, response regulator
MIKTIVVDDELYTLKEICDDLEETGYFLVAGRYQNPLEALGGLSQTLPQVAFIDIEMPEMDGLTLAEKLLEKQPEVMIVFITSWDKYAVKAFDLNALDYILKPIRYPRLLQMTEKIKSQLEQKKPLVFKTLTIQCFGNFETNIGGIPVKWERAKAEELFAFLLVNYGCFIHKEVIIENLWPDYPVEKALPILQTAICKIRNIFSQFKNEVMLSYSQNSYCLTLSNVKCDYLFVKKILDSKNAENAASLYELEGFCAMVQEGFLSNQGYLWSIEHGQYIKKKLFDILENKFEASFTKNIEIKEKVLRLLILLDPYRDKYNILLLQLFMQAGDKEKMNNHIMWLKNIFADEFFTQLPAWMKDFAGKDVFI